MVNTNIYYSFYFWCIDSAYTWICLCPFRICVVLKLSYTLGISAYYHDSAVSLLKNNDIVFAAQEERFTRIKHDPAFPNNSIKAALEHCKINFTDIDGIVFYDKPFLKFERLLETYLHTAPFGFKSFKMSMTLWLREKLFLKRLIYKELLNFDPKFSKDRLFFSEHHLSHAASAFFPSPFEEAIILTLDGVGEWATSSVAIGKKNSIEILKEIHFPHSLGLLYSAFTYYLGFKVNSGEYKVMGLAPYGNPIYDNLIFDKLVDVKNDGSFRLNQKYFNYLSGLTMVNEKFEKLFNTPRRNENDQLTTFHMDIAASIQSVIEKIVLKITKSLAKEYKIKNLCLAGGVALNCVANGKILSQNSYENLWIQPASGDAGGSLGAAFNYWYIELKNKRYVNKEDSMKGSFLGTSFDNKLIEASLKSNGAVFKKLDDKELLFKTAKALSNGKAIGWFRNRMEFGPRSLGARSILCDARPLESQKKLNIKVKFRESFRPFAPVILEEELKNWFELNTISPYMLLVAKVLKSIRKKMTTKQKNLFGIDKLNIKRSSVPAVTHIDYSARIQTVNKTTNKDLYSLLIEFNKITSCPILINTSFNIRGEPIVQSPKDAFNCFMGTDLDVLVIGSFYLIKKDQNKALLLDYRNRFNLD